MGDPVTMAVVGGTIGAAANRKDPLKGALMGAVGGYAGGAMFPTAGSIGAAQGANAMIPGVQGGMGALAGESTALTGASGGLGGIFGGMNIPNTFTGIGKDLSAANTWMKENPQISQLALQTAQSSMQPQRQMTMAPAGQVSRNQIQPMDYMSLLNPQQNVIRPPVASLI
jgi:hypothetical protein